MKLDTTVKTKGLNTGIWKPTGPYITDEGTPTACFDWNKWEPELNKFIPKKLDPSVFYEMGSFLLPTTCCFDCTNDSPCCIAPPCCLCPQIQKCQSSQAGLAPKLAGKISEPEELFGKLLSVRNPKCPPEMQGVFWQRESSQLEHLITFEAGDWTSDGLLVNRRQTFEWSFPDNLLAYSFFMGRTYNWQRTEISPSRRWFFLGEGNQFALFVNENDVFYDADDKKVDWIAPGDLLRLCPDLDKDGKINGLGWGYCARRVAYYDQAGKLVLTDAYQELLARTKLEKKSCLCFMLPTCLMSTEAIAAAKKRLSDTQYFNVRPPQEQMGCYIEMGMKGLEELPAE